MEMVPIYGTKSDDRGKTGYDSRAHELKVYLTEKDVWLLFVCLFVYWMVFGDGVLMSGGR